MTSTALTHFRAQVVPVELDGDLAGGDAVTLLCTGAELYCVELVEKSTLWLSVNPPCKRMQSLHQKCSVLQSTPHCRHAGMQTGRILPLPSGKLFLFFDVSINRNCCRSFSE